MVFDPREILRQHAKGPFKKSWLERDGWWAEHVIERFAEADRHGFELAEVHFHHEGHFVRYAGKNHDLYISYEPDGSARAGLFARAHARYIPIGSLSVEGSAGIPEPPKIDFANRQAVLNAIDRWATVFMDSIDSLVDESPLAPGKAAGDAMGDKFG